MVRRYRPNRKIKPTTDTRYRKNYEIRVPEVMLIDENNDHCGVVPLAEAVRRAQEADLDLVEVSPKANPPVCRIMEFGKFKYDLEKKQKQQKVNQRKSEIKGIRLSLNIKEHDLDVRRKQAESFFGHGHQVRIEIILKGREKGRIPQAHDVIKAFIASLGADTNILQPLTRMGSKVTVLIMKKGGSSVSPVE